MMCEVPSNAMLAAQFLEYYDGFSIGSNDLTQLTLGLDRDSGLELLAKDFNERDPAVKAMLAMSIKACLDQGKYVGICGQGPSDHPDFAKWLVEQATWCPNAPNAPPASPKSATPGAWGSAKPRWARHWLGGWRNWSGQARTTLLYAHEGA
jgi:PEP-utilising enzyme, PEP-binding domain